MSKKPRVKLRWRVGETPTGPYRSFEKRAWPSAEYPNGAYAGNIVCPDSYVPRLARSGEHAPLRVRVADYSKGDKWNPLVSKRSFATLAEAKAELQRLLETFPEIAGSNFE